MSTGCQTVCKWCGKGTTTGFHACEATREIARLEQEAERYKAALEEIANLDTDDFKTDQGHLLPAFQEVNYGAMLQRIHDILCRVLKPPAQEEVPDAEA